MKESKRNYFSATFDIWRSFDWNYWNFQFSWGEFTNVENLLFSTRWKQFKIFLLKTFSSSVSLQISTFNSSNFHFSGWWLREKLLQRIEYFFDFRSSVCGRPFHFPLLFLHILYPSWQPLFHLNFGKSSYDKNSISQVEKFVIYWWSFDELMNFTIHRGHLTFEIEDDLNEFLTSTFQGSSPWPMLSLLISLKIIIIFEPTRNLFIHPTIVLTMGKNNIKKTISWTIRTFEDVFQVFLGK